MPNWEIEPLIRGDDSDEENSTLQWEENLDVRKFEPHPNKNRGYCDIYCYKNLNGDFILSINIEMWSQAGVVLKLYLKDEDSYQKLAKALQGVGVPVPHVKLQAEQPVQLGWEPIPDSELKLGWRNESIPERYRYGLELTRCAKVTTRQLSQILSVANKLCPFSDEMIDDIGNNCLPKEDITTYLSKEPSSLKEQCINYLAQNFETFFAQTTSINQLPQELQEEINLRVKGEKSESAEEEKPSHSP